MQKERGILDSLRMMGQRVAYHPSFARVMNVKSAILLSQFLYWDGKMDGQWFWKNAAEIQEETGLSAKEQATARRELVKLKVLKERYKRFAHQMYFYLNEDAFVGLLERIKELTPQKSDSQTPQTAIPETPKRGLGNRRNGGSYSVDYPQDKEEVLRTSSPAPQEAPRETEINNFSFDLGPPGTSSEGVSTQSCVLGPAPGGQSENKTNRRRGRPMNPENAARWADVDRLGRLWAERYQEAFNTVYLLDHGDNAGWRKHMFGLLGKIQAAELEAMMVWVFESGKGDYWTTLRSFATVDAINKIRAQIVGAKPKVPPRDELLRSYMRTGRPPSGFEPTELERAERLKVAGGDKSFEKAMEAIGRAQEALMAPGTPAVAPGGPAV